MVNQRKYEKYVFKHIPLEGEMPEIEGIPPFPAMLLNYLANENISNTIELFISVSPGIAVGTGEKFGMPPDLGMRYYGGGSTKFESFPYIPTCNVMYCFMGLDPERPDHLGATIEAWIGEGEDAEQYIITKPGVWFTPANVAHGPFVIREQENPIAFMVVLETPNMSMAPTTKRPPGFNFDKIELQQKVENRKYEKYFMDIDVKDIAVPPSHKGKVTPFMFFDYYNNNETNSTIDCRMIRESGISFGSGEATGNPIYEFATFPHKHHTSETYSFVGLNPENPEDLGGTVEFWIGKGNEAEKYIITEPTTIILPKNTVHFPMYVKEVHNPFLMLTVTDMPIWSAKWMIDEFPPDFNL